MPPVDHAVLNEPRFWYSILASQFGNVAQRLDGDLLEAALGTAEAEALSWWDGFTGSYPGVIDEADGYVDDPPLLTLDLSNQVRIAIEYHPGGTYYRLLSDQAGELLGETGPHWRLPGLRWSELTTIAQAAERRGSIREASCFVVLLPLVWPESRSDVPHQERAIAIALEGTGVANPPGARAIAAAWAVDILQIVGVRWTLGANGPMNDSREGTRGLDAADSKVRNLNELIAAASRQADVGPG